MTTYRDSSTYSNRAIQKLRRQLRSENSQPNETVITCGSYSRGEASAQSDIDYFMLVAARSDGSPRPDRKRLAEIEQTIKALIPRGPAKDGAFAKYQTREQLLANIGGQNDSNDNITRRILFLLEGNWLTGESEFVALRRAVLEKYIAPNITDHQLALFLLNDLIRYYRTMAVDYEFKTVQATPRKSWALRNIKLIFSRKLLYASGLFSVALTADRRRDRKIEILVDLFSKPCIERLEAICGKARIARVLACYERFLTCISSAENRGHLEDLALADRDKDPLFRDIKNEGHSFTRELLALFEITFEPTHPIRKAVIF
jgi:predicted nucleotidyltransferase